MKIHTIGVDFDNTVICYDRLFHALALDRALIDTTVRPVKRDIRDTVRLLEDGEVSWQMLQASAYGPMIGQAELFDGFKEFLILCRGKGIEVYIISHKTRYAAQDQKYDMRAAALGFLEEKGLLDHKQFGLNFDRIFFEPTREEKVKRIARLGCAAFIDDLPETFREKMFPADVLKILFNPDTIVDEQDDWLSVPGWKEINTWLTANDYSRKIIC